MAAGRGWLAAAGPVAVGSGPFDWALAMLLADTSSRRLAAARPDEAIESMLMLLD